jgi:hypothetical protein
MPMSIIDLLTAVGVEHVRVQNLHNSAIRYNQRKNGDCAVTILTNQASANDGLGHPHNVGLIVWIPARLIPEQREAK